MTSEEHRRLYKRSGKNAFEIHLIAKDTLNLGQRRERERLITRKRLKFETLHEAGEKLSEEEERLRVEEATKLLKSGQKEEALTALHQSFARDSKNAETFIKLDGLPLLQSCLLSTNSSLLHAAAWCSINLTAADSHLVQKAMRLSPFLIQFLQGSDSVMQELCAWAIGNLAGDSQGSKKTLMSQGVIPHLLNMVSNPHQTLTEAQIQTALHALINLARDKSYDCCKVMLENSLFCHLKNSFKKVPESSQLCLEIGWLTGCVYGREEILTYLASANQCEIILHLVVKKLLHLSQLPNIDWKQKVMVPYLVCIRNMIGLSPDLAILASDLPDFLPAMKACLSSSSHTVLLNTVWTLTNFTAEPSCRAMVICHFDLMSRLLTTCTASEAHLEVVTELLNLLEGMVRLSSVMNVLLIKQGILVSLSQLLQNPTSLVADKVLSIMEILLPVSEPPILSQVTVAGLHSCFAYLSDELEEKLYPSSDLTGVLESLQYVTKVSFDIKLVERAKTLMTLCPLSTNPA